LASNGYVAAENAAPLHFSQPDGGVADGQGIGTPTGSAEPSPKPRFLINPSRMAKSAKIRPRQAEEKNVWP